MKSSKLQLSKVTRLPMTRRSFLSSSAIAATAFSVVPRHVLGAGEASPSAKLNIAGIGVGGMGAGNLEALKSQNIVALCDVDPNHAAKTFKKYPNAKTYTDYREMLEQQKDIDAVLIATPDHTHAVISMAAMKAGKHVYCQKPLTHDVLRSTALGGGGEGVQGGDPDGHPGPLDRQLAVGVRVDLGRGHRRGARGGCVVQLDLLSVGPCVLELEVGRAPQGHAAFAGQIELGPVAGAGAGTALSSGLPPAVWRCWLDFGCGMMGDRGAHTMDVVYWSLKLGAPASIEATCCGLTPEVHPLSSIVTFRFPARDNLPPVKLTWYEGLRPPRPRRWTRT